MERMASSVSLLVLVQLKGARTRMSGTPAPVVILRSPAASMLVTSLTLRYAFSAVGEQTPFAQLMFCVGSVEMFTAACAAADIIVSIQTSAAGIRRVRDDVVSARLSGMVSPVDVPAIIIAPSRRRRKMSRPSLDTEE